MNSNFLGWKMLRIVVRESTLTNLGNVHGFISKK